MKINSDLVKKLRTAKNWSQEQLGETCGLSLRTIQRLENRGNASIESVRVLATAFEIDPNELMCNESEAPLTPLDAVKTGLSEFANFSDVATRFEFWWFLLFVVGVLAISTVLHEKAYQIAGSSFAAFACFDYPAAKDAGQSPWWQLLWFVPFGQVALFFVLAQPSKSQGSQTMEKVRDCLICR